MTKPDVVVVTGSSGFMGSALIKFSLVGFDRMASHAPPAVAECVCIDLTSEAGVKCAFERVRIAYGNRIASVIHLAAYYDLSGEPNPFYEQITVRGTERLLQHLQEFEVEQFIFASTMLVHAPVAPGRRINEDSPIDPRWPYPLSKIETEALIRKEHGDIPIVLLRLAGVYDDRCRTSRSRESHDGYSRDIATESDSMSCCGGSMQASDQSARTAVSAGMPGGLSTSDWLRPFLRDRRVLIIAAIALVVAGVWAGWGWVVALGIAPLILATAPCLIMCALGLCMMGKGMGGQGSGEGSAAGQGMGPGATLDPVSLRALSEGAVASAAYEGRTYYFESRDNRDAFENDPGKYLPENPTMDQPVRTDAGSMARS